MNKNYEIAINKQGKHARVTRDVHVNWTTILATAVFVANTMVANNLPDEARRTQVSHASIATSPATESEESDSSPITVYGENEDRYNQIMGEEILKQMQEEEAAKKAAEEAARIAAEEERARAIAEENSADFQILSMITYAEAGNQTLEQQIAVAATILNRVESGSFPDSIWEVISQKGQFSSVKGGEIYALGERVSFDAVPENCKEAARRALAGEDPTEELLRQEAIRKGLNPEEYATDGALFFYNPEYTGSSELEMRNSIQVKVEFGDHIFYKVW